MGILDTLHDGAFSNEDPLRDAYLKMKSDETEEKVEVPEVESDSKKQVITEKTVNAKIQMDPVGKEDGDVDNDGDKDSSDDYLMKRRKAIQKSIAKNKKKAPAETKLNGTKDDVQINPKIDEMSADKAYKAMDKADKQSRGEMSVMDPKKAKKRARQAQKFADYSIKKTLNKEEFDVMHEIALEENMKRDLIGFGAKLQAYADKKGGIDKDYFSKIAKTAMSGRMPAKKDIDGDTDPRDFVLKMMTQTFPKSTMKNYIGISPTFDQHMKESYDVKTAKTKYGKITVKSFDSHDDAKAHLASMNKKGHKGIISQGGKPVKEGDMKIPPYANRKTAQAEKKARELAQRKRAGLDEARKSDYQLYHKDFSSAMQHAYAVAKKRGYTVDKDDIDNKVATGPRKPSSGKTNRYILGTDKKQNLHVQVANLDNKRFELNMYIESVQEEDMKTFKQVLEHCGECGAEAHADDVNEVESKYAKEIAAYKAKGGTIKKHTMDKSKVKKAVGDFKKKFQKTQQIIALQKAKERAEKEANKQQDEVYKVGRTTYKNEKEYEKAIASVKEPNVKDLHPLVRKSMKKNNEETEVNEISSGLAHRAADAARKKAGDLAYQRDKRRHQEGQHGTKLSSMDKGGSAELARKSNKKVKQAGRLRDKAYDRQDREQRARDMKESEVNEISSKLMQRASDKAHGKSAELAYQRDKRRHQEGQHGTKLSSMDKGGSRELGDKSNKKYRQGQRLSRASAEKAHQEKMARDMKESEVNEISSKLMYRASDAAHKKAGDLAYQRDKRRHKEGQHGSNLSSMDKGGSRELGDKSNKKVRQGQRLAQKAGEKAHQEKMARDMKESEVSKNVSKLNKVLENRKRELKEGNITNQNNTMFRRFESMVEYLLGVSVENPDQFQVFPVGDNYRLEYEHGPVTTLGENDIINFMGPNVDKEMFIDLLKEFGVAITTEENSFVRGERDQVYKEVETPYGEKVSTDPPSTVPEEVSQDYADRYKMDNIVELIKKNANSIGGLGGPKYV